MNDHRQQLRDLVGKPAAVAWFRGLFKRVHVELLSTGERFTVFHHGDRAEVGEGFTGGEPNFVVPLEPENIARLCAVFDDGVASPFEEYRIVKFMLQPCLRASLAMPILRHKALLDILKVETHWQEALLDPEGREDEQLTVVFVNGQWLVIPGYHGRPPRRVRVTPADVLDFQRRIFAADEAGGITAWLQLARWYVDWREGITVPSDPGAAGAAPGPSLAAPSPAR
jgi:hypothetical protein